MRMGCTNRRVAVLCLLLGSLWQLGSSLVAPGTATLTGVSLEPGSDGSDFILRLHADAEIPWYSHTEFDNAAGIKVTLLNTKIAPNASLDDPAGPFRSYEIYQDGGKVILDATFVAPGLSAIVRPDASSNDILLIVSQPAVHAFLTETFQPSAAQSPAVLEMLIAESVRTDSTPKNTATEDKTPAPGSTVPIKEVNHDSASTAERKTLNMVQAQKISLANPAALPERSDLAAVSKNSDDTSSREILSDVDRMFASVLKKPKQQDVSAEITESTSGNDRWKLDTVVLDAGHGGWDEGAFGIAGLLEKNLALKISEMVGARLEKELGINVVHTRSDDRFVTLAERGHIANQAGGKLFLSIHANSAKARSARGTETYFLGTHRTDSARVVMERENEVIKLESDQNQYIKFDNATLAQQALAQSSFMRHSEMLADAMQKQFTDAVGRKDRGVKQAGFYVLFGASMPAVLIELGFLTNPFEEKFLSSKDGQTSMANAIFRAVLNFKQDYEKSLQVASH